MLELVSAPDWQVQYSDRKNTSLTSVMRLGSICGHVFAEGMKKGDLDRTFHFLSIEVKGKGGQIGNTEAEYQNLNTAAQALHNMYVVMQEAEMEDTFFENVRFFSVVATTAGFELRVHRATRLEPQEYITPTYGVGYAFDEVLNIGSDYTKAMASTIIYNILFHYAVVKLYPILKEAMETVLKRHPGLVGEATVAKAPQPSRSSWIAEAPGPVTQVAPPKGKRAGDDDLSASFGSHASHQRRRLGGLAVNDSD